MIRMAIVSIAALLLMGCGEDRPPEPCEMKAITYYAYNHTLEAWKGPRVTTLCVVRSEALDGGKKK